MTVLDASVAVKWFKVEAGSDHAQRLLEEQQGHLHVPGIFVVEVAATIVRLANANEAPPETTDAALYALLDLIDRRVLLVEQTPPGQVVEAAHLAVRIGHPLKDCLYLALAIALGRPLVTADAKFAAKAREVWDQIVVLADP